MQPVVEHSGRGGRGEGVRGRDTGVLQWYKQYKHSTAQHSTAQHSAAQRSTVQRGKAGQPTADSTNPSLVNVVCAWLTPAVALCHDSCPPKKQTVRALPDCWWGVAETIRGLNGRKSKAACTHRAHTSLAEANTTTAQPKQH